jgi:streptomycin 6-kinase
MGTGESLAPSWRCSPERQNSLARAGTAIPVRVIRIPPQLLADAVDEEDYPARVEWLAALPDVIATIALDWGLELSEPYVPGGQCAWVAPVRDDQGERLVLKVGWRHREAEHEADALRLWEGDGAVRCYKTRSMEDTTALLLERCVPGEQLKRTLQEPEQDVVVATLLRRLWAHEPSDGKPFAPLYQICDQWANSFELGLERDSRGLDPGLARDGIALLRELPRSADRTALLCTDLHAGNVLTSQREPWLVIDPKPFLGDPAFDPVQHMLNCDERLATDPEGLSRRMAELLELDAERVRWWLFARCVQESLCDLSMREPARQLVP